MNRKRARGTLAGGKGRFRPGRSGNPAGRPRKTADERLATRAERAALKRASQDTYQAVIEGVRIAQSYAPEVIEKFAELARSDDAEIALKAGTALLDRALWPRDASAMPHMLPAFAKGTIADRANVILTAVAEGRITPQMGSTLANLLNLATDASLSAEVAAKLHELRQALQARGLSHLAPPVPTIEAAK